VTRAATNGQWWQSLLIWSDEEEKRAGCEGESWCRLHYASMVRLKEGREEKETHEKQGRRGGRAARVRARCGGTYAAHRREAELGEGHLTAGAGCQ
jgi:hypothetical protein